MQGMGRLFCNWSLLDVETFLRDDERPGGGQARARLAVRAPLLLTYLSISGPLRSCKGGVVRGDQLIPGSLVHTKLLAGPPAWLQRKLWAEH